MTCHMGRCVTQAERAAWLKIGAFSHRVSHWTHMTGTLCLVIMTIPKCPFGIFINTRKSLPVHTMIHIYIHNIALLHPYFVISGLKKIHINIIFKTKNESILAGHVSVLLHLNFLACDWLKLIGAEGFCCLNVWFQTFLKSSWLHKRCLWTTDVKKLSSNYVLKLKTCPNNSA